MFKSNHADAFLALYTLQGQKGADYDYARPCTIDVF